MQILSITLLFLRIFTSVSFLHSEAKEINSTHFPNSDFIEDIIEIKIPGLDGAYNASIVEFENGYLMAFRYDTYKEPIGSNLNAYYQHIGMILLNENFEPTSPWKHCIGNRTYDPRLLKIDDTIYMIFASANPMDSNSNQSSRLNLCAIDCSTMEIDIDSLNYLKCSFGQKWEKNWVLFSYENEIFLEYQISPHIILKPSLFNGHCTHETFINENENSPRSIEWNYGIIRGGTPAILVDDKYLGFFHSSQRNPETKKYTYYVGAYLFSNVPPFTLEKASRHPFFHTNFYSTCKSAKSESQVIFPGGFIIKGDKIFLCYGENDNAIKIMVLNKERLYTTLQNVL